MVVGFIYLSHCRLSGNEQRKVRMSPKCKVPGADQAPQIYLRELYRLPHRSFQGIDHKAALQRLCAVLSMSHQATSCLHASFHNSRSSEFEPSMQHAFMGVT